jgi:hypothetical protein
MVDSIYVAMVTFYVFSSAKPLVFAYKFFKEIWQKTCSSSEPPPPFLATVLATNNFLVGLPQLLAEEQLLKLDP